MKIKILKCIAIAGLLAPFMMVKAQIKTRIYTEGIPASMVAAKTTPIAEKLVSMPDGFLNMLNKSAGSTNQSEYSNSFALTKQVSLNVLSEATVREEKGFTTYLLTINAENARNLSLQFSVFFLPEKSILRIYNQYELTADITSKENNEQGVWATRVYQGNTLTLELIVPKEARKMARLLIDKINFGYKPFGTEYFGNPGASVACNINVVCPEAVGWENERNSVALIVVNGNESCTGSLIMNTCNTNIPYFLTANHCLGAGNVNNWVFQFQTWSATCIPNGVFREDVQFNGCTLRANNAASDFALLQLNNAPAPGSGITYSGWNRDAAAPAGTVGLHHPAGDLMKFCRDFDPSGASSWGGFRNHWVSVFEQGTVQPGSSGSPLYNMNHQIVGQLHGDQLNQGNYCAQRRGEYGKFDASWTGGGTATTRLSDWLDPTGTGAITTNTSDVSVLVPTSYSATISGNTSVCSGTSAYTITGVPAAGTITWSVSPAGIATLGSTTGTSTTLTVTGSGTVTLTATVNICGLPANPINYLLHVGAYNSSDYSLNVSGGNGATNGYLQWCPNTTYGFSISGNTVGSTSSNWVWSPSLPPPNNQPQGWSINYLSGYVCALRSPSGTYPPTGTISVSFTEGCGSTISKSMFLAYSPSACNYTNPCYQYSPNPAPYYLNVNVAPSCLGTTYIRKIELVQGSTGLSVYYQDYTYGNVTSTTVTMASYPTGAYYLKLYDGNTWSTYSIIH